MIYHVVVFAHNSPNTDGREQTVYRGDVKEQIITCNISNFKWIKKSWTFLIYILKLCTYIILNIIQGNSVFHLVTCCKISATFLPESCQRDFCLSWWLYCLTTATLMIPLDIIWRYICVKCRASEKTSALLFRVMRADFNCRAH